MLNDLSTFTRVTFFSQMLPFGMFIGLIVSITINPDAGLAGYVIVFALAITVVILWCIIIFTWMPVRARRLHNEIERGSREIVSGQVHSTVVPARVVRTRAWKHHRPWALGREPQPGTLALSAAFTVLPPDGPPRRVGALVPIQLVDKAVAMVALHPSSPEVGVIDMRVTNDQLAAADRDPRWSSAVIPTDRDVLGGYRNLAGAALAGILAGGLLAVLIMQVASL